MHLGFGACICFAKSNDMWFCGIVDDPWWFLDAFWCVLISCRLIFEGFRGGRWFPWSLGPLSPNISLAFVSFVFCQGFEEAPHNLPITLCVRLWTYGYKKLLHKKRDPTFTPKFESSRIKSCQHQTKSTEHLKKSGPQPNNLVSCLLALPVHHDFC